MLKNRYKDKKLITHTLVKAIFDLQPLETESYANLTQLLVNFNKNVRAFFALGQHTDTWDT